MTENLYIIYNCDTGEYDIKTVVREIFPEENIVVVDISHWDKEDLSAWERRVHEERLAELEGMELVDEIKTELQRRPL